MRIKMILKAGLVVILASTWVSTSYAQVAKVTQHANIKATEVPFSVLRSFEETFGTIPGGGYWTVYFVRSEPGSALPTAPRTYAYRRGGKSNKIEIRFAPDGAIQSEKGLERLTAKKE